MVSQGAVYPSFGQAKATAVPYQFPSSHDKKPANWSGPVFKLSQNYPKTMPVAEAYPWTQVDFKNDWKQYMQSVIDYCFEGNIHGGDQQSDFLPGTNTKRQWYHAPWQHWGPGGREFIHGLTAERMSVPLELGPSQTSMFQNWAVGFYNAPGGYCIGRVWDDPKAPDPKAAHFADGTVSFKLLFTAANKAEVPYLDRSPEWQANITAPCDPQHPGMTLRRPQTLRLLQVDVAVKDKRSPTGWVFGTFVYNGKLNGDPWRRLTPVGLMWGDDPGYTQQDAKSGKKLTECRINDDPNMPPQHLGWAGRLDGPVDNPGSSCLSCHQTSEFPGWIDSAMVPLPKLTEWDEATHQHKQVVVAPDSKEFMRWFQNLKPGEPFDRGRAPLDDSLQLQVGIQNFYQWKAITVNQGGALNTYEIKPKQDPFLQGYRTNRDGVLIPLSTTEMQ